MSRYLLPLIAILTLLCRAQERNTTNPVDHSDLAAALAFEAQASGDHPGGWGGGPPGTIFTDDGIFHGGQAAVRLERHPGSPGNFSTVTKSLPINFSGAMVELRGFLRTEDVSNFAGLWMREDGESGSLAFDNMQAAQLKGSTDWKEYSITLPIHADAQTLYFGVLLSGTGKAWADDLQLLIDGKPVWDAPKGQPTQTVIDRDHEFDAGSGITINQLTKIQIDNLVVLAKVWGFLKYHHPKVTSGERHWDYDLFHVLPTVLAAPDRATANAAIQEWIEQLGPVAPCNPCAKLDEKNIYYRPDLDWIADKALLGAGLSQMLRSIRDNRLPGKQFFVSKVPGIGNPNFEHEPAYPNLKLPDAGYQLLALYRFWNIIEYWSPYRDLTAENWNRVLQEFVPRIANTKTAESYRQEMFALIAEARDGHANFWHALDARPPLGPCQLPITLRFVDHKPVITARASADASHPTDLQVGDVLRALDGVPVAKLLETWTPYYAGSNEAARLSDLARYMTRGACGETSITVRRQDIPSDHHDLTLKINRVTAASDAPTTVLTHDLPGPTFRLLSKDVAYLKLSSVKSADIASYLKQAAATRGLIIDIRNYPSDFVVFVLGTHLVSSKTSFATFTEGDLENPGAFHWGETESLDPEPPRYPGKVVILVDETSMSQAEYSAMAFRSVPGAVVIGSTTSGADGNVSPFSLPGDLRTMISGIGVFYPDKTPTEQIGIVPNVKVTPTFAGIRAGRDEVLEHALRRILGPTISAPDIEKLANP